MRDFTVLIVVVISAAFSLLFMGDDAIAATPARCNGTLPTKLCEAIRHHTRHPEWANSVSLGRIVWLESSNDPCAVFPNRHGKAWCGYSGRNACGWFMLNPCRCNLNAVSQARCGVRYIEARYGEPDSAWVFWSKHRSY